MKRGLRAFAGAAGLLVVWLLAVTASAQNPGGVLQISHRDSPASMSTLEEVTISTIAPMMAVFNNLVIFDQHVPQNTLQSIVPGSRDELVMERGRHGTELSATRKRSLARRAAVYGKRRPVHLGHAAWQVGRQVSHQPAQVVVLESGSRNHQWRL